MAWWYPLIIVLGCIVLGILALIAKRWYVFVLGMSAVLGIVSLDYLLVAFSIPPALRLLAYVLGGVVFIATGLRLQLRHEPHKDKG